MSYPQNDYSSLSPRWRERFEFFDQYGAPGTASYKAGIKALSPKKRILIGVNFIAFFGLIYYFVLGLWKKNLAIMGGYIVLAIVISIVLSLLGIDSERTLRHTSYAFNGGFTMLYMQVANYAYYLKVTQGKQGWNPFEGMKMF